jgi:hypothetical protein
MKNKRLAVALAFFILPFMMRGLWFYRGIYFPAGRETSPDFSAFTVIQPALSTLPAFQEIHNGEGKRILFDQAHNNQFTLAEIESLRELLLNQGAEIIELRPKADLPEMLKKADAFVTITPTDFFAESDLKAIEDFVARGGRLLVIADPTRSLSEYDKDREKSVILTNDILEPFRIAFRNDYVYSLVNNEGNYRNIHINPSGSHSLTMKLSNLVFYAAHSVTSLDNVLLTGDETSLSSLDDQGTRLPVAAMDESGNVLVIGDMTFMTTPYYQVADNYQLIINISEFLLDNDRSRTLADFPNIFTRPVGIQLSNGIILDKDLLSAIAGLKEVLAANGFPLAIIEEGQAGFDQIIIGTYPPNVELRVFTDAMGLDFGDVLVIPTPTQTPEDLPATPEATQNFAISEGQEFFIPGFGKVPSEGFGFLLLKEEPDQVILIILADSQKNAVHLLTLLVKGSLDSCLANDTIAVCEQDAALSKTISEEETPEPLEEVPLEELLNGTEDVYTPTPSPVAITPTPTTNP